MCSLWIHRSKGDKLEEAIEETEPLGWLWGWYLGYLLPKKGSKGNNWKYRQIQKASVGAKCLFLLLIRHCSNKSE